MARFEHHVAVAWALGSGYAAFHAFQHQLPWQEAATAAVLCTVGGILPDVDSPGSRFAEFVFSTGALLGVLIGSHFLHLPLSEVSTLGSAIALFWMLRWGLRYLLSQLTTHRGMVHSLPAAAIWGMLVFLAFSGNALDLRLTMATAAVLGFLSHLVLDELFAFVDASGTRLAPKRSFGSVLKLWSSSPLATASTYGLVVLFLWLCWRSLP